MNLLEGLIQEADIRWASELMGLGPDGFSSVGEDNSRGQAMLSMETADFEACPGSGKTTLLVAKLAILARRWPYRQRGICVLSHTNVARDEIEGRLSRAPAGSALVRYPHFVGTIHSFVNEYLAIPWLRSKGNPVRLIDTDAALSKRARTLGVPTMLYLERKHLDERALSYDAVDYTGGMKGTLGPDTETYKKLVRIAKQSSEDGYFCFDEMFVWANELLDKHPEVVASLRKRFPIVFIDEAQDNRELQAKLLHRLFLEGDAPSLCQRFGDSNQAIYMNTEEADPDTDPFPSGVVHSLPRSYRFGQTIADLTNGLGIAPHGLEGAGPSGNRVASDNKTPVLFLFDDMSVSDVLPRYAEHLTACFSEDELTSGSYFAISGVHRLSTDDKIPRAMGHYAPNYNPAQARKDASPSNFAHHVARAQSETAGVGDVHQVVNAVASALFALNELRGSPRDEAQRKSPHNRLTSALVGHHARAQYLDLLSIITERDWLDPTTWTEEVVPLVRSVAVALNSNENFDRLAEAFLVWPALQNRDAPQGHAAQASNLFAYPPDAPKVHIKLGSIHSVKGETHTATLVLESFSHKHHLAALKPWLLGQKSGGSSTNRRKEIVWEGVQTRARLKLHYVAMTRPSHLLCLAMRHDTFTAEELDRKSVV